LWQVKFRVHGDRRLTLSQQAPASKRTHRQLREGFQDGGMT
jgi:hypothetical protein